jgi:serine phosphatase RsbU (regulator of sigma subunit)
MNPTKHDQVGGDWPEPSRFRRSIWLEFTIYVSMIILALMLVTGYVISNRYVNTVTRNVADKILVQARSYSGPAGKMIISGTEPDVLMLNNVCKRIALDNEDVYWAGITGDDDTFIAHTDIKQVVSLNQMRTIGATRFSDMLRPSEGFELKGDTVYTSVPIEENEVLLGRLVVAASAAPIAEARTASLTTVASITAVMILLGIPVMMLVVRRKLRPIKVISDHLKSMDLSNISLEIPFHSANEFGFLAETLRAMGSKLNAAQMERIERERMSRELEIAREIQASILPKGYPQGQGFELYGAYKSAREVGGDYYDFIEYDDNHLGVLIADVSGKSLPGMLVMLLTRDIVRRLANSITQPSELLSAANEELHGNMKTGMFVTMFFGVLDVRTGRFRFASAGHNPLVVVKGETGQAELIKTKGYPLGMVDSRMYRERIESGEIAVSPGDWLVLYTDGINEAQNSRGEEFGTERFVDVVRAHKDGDAVRLVDKIKDEHSSFVGDAAQFDDITLIAIKRKCKTADRELERSRETANVS